jgi:N-acetylneuraminic acid mutarotase
MKYNSTHGIVLFFCINLLSFNVHALTWTQKASFSPGNRYGAYGFSIGIYGYVGSGSVQNGPAYTLINDLWEYNSVTDSWAQKAALPAGGRVGASAFTIVDKGYVTTGYDFVNYLDDLWQYDPSANMWIQKASFPGGTRYSCASFAINEYGFVGMGKSGGYYSDFFRYDVQADAWDTIQSIPGVARQSAKGFTIDGYGFVVGGAEQSSMYNCKNTYRYDPIGDNWLQVSDYPGNGSHGFAGFVINDIAYIGTGTLLSLSNPVFNDLYAYDAITDVWTPITSFTGGIRQGAVSMAIGSQGFVGLGSSVIFPSLNYFDDWWTMVDQTGIIENENNNHTSIYIDNQQNLHIELQQASSDNQNVLIFNSTGQVIEKNQLVSQQREIIISMKKYAFGVYHYTVQGNGNNIAGKFAYFK